jgi:hypothetical protein
MITENN